MKRWRHRYSSAGRPFPTVCGEEGKNSSHNWYTVNCPACLDIHDLHNSKSDRNIIPAHRFNFEGPAREVLSQVKEVFDKRYGDVDHFKVTISPFKKLDAPLFPPGEVAKIKPSHPSTKQGAQTLLVISCNMKNTPTYTGWINSDKSCSPQTFFEYDLAP